MSESTTVPIQPTLVLSSSTRSLDEDANNRGGRVAYNGEAGPNVVAAASPGSNQLRLVDLDSANLAGGYLQVSVAGGTLTGLRLGVSTLSGVFRVDSTTGQVSYSPDATFYGTTVKDAAGLVLHNPGEPAQAGTQWVLVGQIDNALRGANGQPLKITFNEQATPAIVQSLASHVAIVPLDTAGKYTQNWEAVAGTKTVSFEVSDSVSGTAVTASKAVELVARAETGVPVLNFLPVIREINEDANNTGRLVAFNGEEGPHVAFPGGVNSNQVVLIDSDAGQNYGGGSLTASVVSGNMNQLQLGVSTTSGVFSVMDGQVKYYRGAKYYGSDVVAAGKKTFDPHTPGTEANAVVIGQVDTTLNGRFGQSLKITFNEQATPAIVQTLAASIYLGVRDATTGNLTQNWSAAAGEKLVSFALKESATAAAVTASRTMRINSDPSDDEPPSLTVSSAVRILDEDINPIGGRVAYNGEAGLNVVAAAAPGTNQLRLVDTDSTNFAGGYLKVSIAGGVLTGLRLGVSQFSGVFKVNTSTNEISYSSDATYYGTTVKDAAGLVIHNPGEPAQAGTQWVVVGQLDTTLNGFNGQPLKITLNTAATPAIVQSLAAHVGIVPLDTVGKYTQNWEAVAGTKTVTFEVSDSVSGTPVTASRTLELVSHAETGVPALGFLSVLRWMDENNNNSGTLVAFNGEAGPHVAVPSGVNSNQVLLFDSDAGQNYGGGSLTASVVSGNMNQLQLGVSSTSGVFRVSTDGQVKYYRDAKYYGSNVTDASGTVTNKTFDPHTPGTEANAVVIGQVDTTLNGRFGQSLKITFNEQATPAIVQTLAASIYLGVRDATTGNLTQNWLAAAGEKLVSFALKESATAAAVTASRIVRISSDPTDDDTPFNAGASIASGTLGTNEWFDDLFVDTAATTLPGYIASGSDFRLFHDTDNDAATFKIVTVDSGGWVETGSIRFVDTNGNTADGPESFVYTGQTSIKTMPLLYESAGATNPSSFVFSNEQNAGVIVALNYSSTTPGVLATFNANVKDEGGNTVTFSGQIWDKNGDGKPDASEGQFGSEPFSIEMDWRDSDNDNKADQVRLFEAPGQGSGWVQKDSAGKITGLYGVDGEPPSLTVSSSTRSLDEDANNRGGRVAYNGEAGPNVVAAASPGSNQLRLVDLDSANLAGGYLQVSVAAAEGGSLTGIRLLVSTLSGVFRVDNTTGQVSYSSDATYYGTTVKDAAGLVMHNPGEPAKSGTQWVTVGKIDDTLKGFNGQALKITFNEQATPSIVQSLASHVSIVPYDTDNRYTQNWEAVAGTKKVTFEVTDSALGTPATASRSVNLVAHAEDGVPNLMFVPVLKVMSEDSFNSGQLLAFNGEAGPNVSFPSGVRTNELILTDSDSTNYEGGSLIASVISGNMAQLRLGIAGYSRIFKVDSNGDLKYYRDATYYGTKVKDDAGVEHPSFSPHTLGTETNAVIIGKVDATLNGFLGQALKITFNELATPEIVQTLAANIYLGVTDSTKNWTQNWSAAAGEKLVSFALKESATAAAVTASRTVRISSDPTDDDTPFNAGASIASGTLGTNEWFDDLFVDTAATTLPGYIASGSDFRLFHDTDNDATTFKVVTVDSGGWVETGSIRFVDTNGNTADGPESFVYTGQTSIKTMPLLYESAGATNPSSFVFSNEQNDGVIVALNYSSTTPGVLATFNANVKDEGGNTVTFSGQIWDKSGDGKADTLVGQFGVETINLSLAMADTDRDGKANQFQLYEAAEEGSNGWVQKDSAGKITGLYGTNASEVVQKGIAQDGYIAHALVWTDTDGDGLWAHESFVDKNNNQQVEAGEYLDANQNGVFDAESWRITNTSGEFDGLTGTGNLKIQAWVYNASGMVPTIDLSTGKTFSGSLTAPSGSSVINPLTTLVQSAMASGGKSEADAQALVRKALGVADTVDLLNYDPVAQSQNSGQASVALQVQKAALQVANLMQVAVDTTAAAGATNPGEVVSSVATTLVSAATAAASHATPGIDLSSAALMTSAISAAANSAFTASTDTTAKAVLTAQAASIGAALSQVNASIDTIVSNAQTTATASGQTVDAAAAMVNIVAAQIVVQEQVSAQAQSSVVQAVLTGDTTSAGSIAVNVAQSLELAKSKVAQVFVAQQGAAPLAVNDQVRLQLPGNLAGEREAKTESGNVLGNDTAGANYAKAITSGGAGAAAISQTSLNSGRLELTGNFGSLVLNSNGTFTYTEDKTKTASIAANQSAQDVFTYVLADSTNADNRTDTATLTIGLDRLNFAPSVQVGQLRLKEQGAGFAGDGETLLNLRGLVSDADDDALTVSGIKVGSQLVSGTTPLATQYGTLSFKDGNYFYAPNQQLAAVQALVAGQTLTETVGFMVSDGVNPAVNSAMIITLQGTNDAPVLVQAQADIRVTEGRTLNVTLPAFADMDDATLAYSAKLASGAALPSWLHFDAATRVLGIHPGENVVESAAQAFTVEVTATDHAGFTASDSFDVRVQPLGSGYDIQAKVMFWKPTNAGSKPPLAGVKIAKGGVEQTTASSDTAVTLSSIEDDEGEDDGVMSLSPTATAPSNAKSAIGLTDVLAALKVYLGKSLPDAYASPLNVVAADFDANGQVNLTDVLSLLKYYLGKATPSAPQWVFVDEADLIEGGTRLRAADDSLVSKTNTTPHAIDQSFADGQTVQIIGVLRGDVDGSWAPPL